MGNVDYIYESMKLTSSLCTIIAAEILGLCDSYSLQRREFYFDRSPRIFENILGLYRKGELHLTERVCPRDFLGKRNAKEHFETFFLSCTVYFSLTYLHCIKAEINFQHKDEQSSNS